MNYPKYEIWSIHDLIEAAEHTQNIDDLFIDLKTYVEVALELKKISPAIVPTKFTWIDDMQHNASIKIVTELP